MTRPLLPLSRRRFLKSGAATTLVAAMPGASTGKPVSLPAHLSLLVVGDWGRRNEIQAQVARQMTRTGAQNNVAFVISTGDNFYSNGVTSVSDPLWKEVFEDVYVGQSLRCPWYPVLGNHDHRGNALAQVAYSQISSRWSMRNLYYAVPAALPAGGEAEFFFLDTTIIVAENSGTESSFFDEDNQQLAWLDRSLSVSNARWKIVIGHHPVYSGGKHGPTASLQRMLQPMLKRHGVRVYLNGHDHDLQHIYVDGIHYLTSGAGSSPRTASATAGTRFSSDEPGFLLASLSAETFDFKFVRADGSKLYSHAIELTA